MFVDENGEVENFNHNNREIRTDFLAGGVIEEYDSGTHSDEVYNRLMQSWSDFSY